MAERYKDSIYSRIDLNDNYIINGDFRYWQRGTSFSGLIQSNTPVYTADRWQYDANSTGLGVNLTNSASSPTVAESDYNSSSSSLLLTSMTADSSVAAGDHAGIVYYMEGYQARELLEQTMTLSFWVRSNQTGTYCFSMRNTNDNQSFISEYTINSSNTWEKKEIQIYFDTLSGSATNWADGIGLKLHWTLRCGTTYQTSTKDQFVLGNYRGTSNQTTWGDQISDVFYLSQVKLERGIRATTYTARPPAVEAALCRRYYYRLTEIDDIGCGTVSNSSGTFHVALNIPADMRAAPTVSGSGSGTFNLYYGLGFWTTVAFTSATNGVGVFTYSGAQTFTYGYAAVIQARSTGYVELDAEL
jgi:hypothetical protein